MNIARGRRGPVYWVICAVLLVFAIRYMLHYRQTIENAIHFSDKNVNDKK